MGNNKAVHQALPRHQELQKAVYSALFFEKLFMPTSLS